MHARLNLEFGTATQKKSVRKMLLCRARASHSACCTQWPPCFLGKGEHEPGDTASNALAPAWPSMCARQAQIMAPGRFCYLPRPNTRPTRKGRAGQTPQNPARCNSGGRAGASPVCPSVRAHARGTVRVSVCGHAECEFLNLPRFKPLLSSQPGKEPLPRQNL